MDATTDNASPLGDLSDPHARCLRVFQHKARAAANTDELTIAEVNAFADLLGEDGELKPESDVRFRELWRAMIRRQGEEVPRADAAEQPDTNDSEH